MAYASEPYRNAVTIANHLMRLILQPNEDNRNVALLTREWLNIEYAKREWRGLPRLKPHTMREIFEAERQEAKNITTNAATFAEITPTTTEGEPKESLNPETVPTPPAVMPP